METRIVCLVVAALIFGLVSSGCIQVGPVLPEPKTLNTQNSMAKSELRFTIEQLEQMYLDHNKLYVEEIDCNNSNYQKLNKIKIAGQTELTNRVEEAMLVAEWYPSISQGRFGIISLEYANIGCQKISVQKIIEEAYLIKDNKILNYGSDNLFWPVDFNAFPGDQIAPAFATPISGSRLESLEVRQQGIYFVYFVFIDEDTGELLGVYKRQLEMK